MTKRKNKKKVEVSKKIYFVSYLYKYNKNLNRVTMNLQFSKKINYSYKKNQPPRNTSTIIKSLINEIIKGSCPQLPTKIIVNGIIEETLKKIFSQQQITSSKTNDKEIDGCDNKDKISENDENICEINKLIDNNGKYEKNQTNNRKNSNINCETNQLIKNNKKYTNQINKEKNIYIQDKLDLFSNKLDLFSNKSYDKNKKNSGKYLNNQINKEKNMYIQHKLDINKNKTYKKNKKNIYKQDKLDIYNLLTNQRQTNNTPVKYKNINLTKINYKGQQIIFNKNGDNFIKLAEEFSRNLYELNKIRGSQRKNEEPPKEIKSFYKMSNKERKINIKSYYRKKYELFHKYDYGVLLDDEGWYSVTPEIIAKRIASRCIGSVVIDGFCGVGGNSIQFALKCDHVIAIDNNKERLEMARHNAKVYGVENKIDFICANFFNLIDILKGEVVYLSPPWGGPDYVKQDIYNIENMLNYKGKVLIEKVKKITRNIILSLPNNIDHSEIYEMINQCEIENNIVNGRNVMTTVYLGDLVNMNKFMP